MSYFSWNRVQQRKEKNSDEDKIIRGRFQVCPIDGNEQQQ